MSDQIRHPAPDSRVAPRARELAALCIPSGEAVKWVDAMLRTTNSWHHFFRPCCFGTRFLFGVNVVAALWYPYPYPVYSPPVAVESSPAYVQTDTQPQQYWSYCQDAQAYYPYVKECPAGWLQVVPQPPPPSSQ